MERIWRGKSSGNLRSISINGHLPLYYLLDYFPMSRVSSLDSEASRRNRELVWKFKNSDDRTTEQEHEAAMVFVIEQVSEGLREAYAQKLEGVYLVCLPASSQEKTERRYRAFSRRLCEELLIGNASEHIRVVADAVPKHEGGSGVPCVQITPGYFKSKHVILFDDVYTSGSSMRYYISQMEKRGAKVEGCVTVAKTVGKKGRFMSLVQRILKYLSKNH